MTDAVLVHSCFSRTQIQDWKHLQEGRLYYSDDPKFRSFKPVSLKCSCKLVISYNEAEIYLNQGKAFEIYKPDPLKPIDEVKPVEGQIAMPVIRSQTPRVDLITKADMERAYVYGYKKYIDHIEEVHAMILSERARLVVPFKPDPQEGRLLFPFGPDQRTHGGHA